MRRTLTHLLASLPLLLAFAPRPALAQTAPSVDTPAGKLTLGGYVEAAYSYNFNDPSSGLTAYRGFDNRHNTFTLSNVVLDGQWEKDAVSGRVTLQAGHTPSTYYLAEPSSPGSGSVGSADASTWKYIQQAYVAYKAPVGKGLTFQLGLFLSPIGMESMAVKDDWSWSRSNLFFGLPFYHTGLRGTQQLTDELALTIAVYNGWNSVVDNNPQKSVSAQLAYTDSDKLLFSVLYFGGVERPVSAPEGKPWRHLLDGWIQARIAAPLWLAASADTGFESTRFGTSSWAAAALYAQVRAASFLYLVARGDYFHEHAAQSASGTAARLFWPGDWVASGTATVDVRPRDNISIRVEYRHDQGQVDMFFKGRASGDGSTATPFVPNARGQDTLTLGVTTWL
ncbi:MAG: outer membrane beta-barrel protein [Byssovorax sp.]